MSVLFSISIVLIVFKFTVYYNNGLKEEFIKDYNNEYGCYIDNLLFCNSDYYEDDQFIIDLEYEDDGYIVGNGFILTRDKIISRTGEFTYEELFIGFEYEKSNLTIEDALGLLEDYLDEYKLLIITIIIVFFAIGNLIFLLIINLLRALIVNLLVKNILKINLKYNQMYKLTIYIYTPVAIVNAIRRIFLYSTFTGYIISFMPFYGGLTKFILNYGILFGLTYLALKSHENENMNTKSVPGYKPVEL